MERPSFGRKVILPPRVESIPRESEHEQHRRKTLAESIAEAISRATGGRGLPSLPGEEPKGAVVVTQRVGAPGSTGKRQRKNARRKARLARGKTLPHGRARLSVRPMERVK